MRLIVFPRELHGGQIHSVDINQDNSKVLTSGVDGKVLIWAFKDLVELSQWDQRDVGEQISRVEPLREIETHGSVVVLCRWSPVDADVFISADIDGTVILHHCDQEEVVETICPFQDGKELAGAKFIDLTWSPDGRLVVWCTSDGKLHLVDVVQKTYQELSTLNGPDKLNCQRSVAFDPTNNFLVSVGEDSVILIYQYQIESLAAGGTNYKFRLVSKIAKLINKTTLNVDYRRVSWSPDGEFISIPTAAKSQASMISLLSRSSDWYNVLSLVGHNFDCEVVRYNPNVFSYANNPQDPDAYHIIATAGSDMTLVVWNTSKDMPVFVLKEISKKPIVDVCWDKLGHTLLVASLDGHLSVVTFEEQELGIKTDNDTLRKLLESSKNEIKPFDRKLDQEGTPSTKKGSGSTAVDVLNQKDAQKIEELRTTELEAVEKNNDTSDETHQETKLEENAQEINLNILPLDTEVVPEVIGAPELSNVSTGTGDMLQSAMTSSRSQKAATKTNGSKLEGAKPKFEADRKMLEKVKIVNGKKRIQPTLISKIHGNDNAEATTSSPSIQVTSPATPSSAKIMMEFEKPSYSVSENLYKETKRLKGQDEGSNKKTKRELEPVKFLGSVVVNPNTTFAKVRLAIPKIRMNFQLTSKHDVQSGEPLVFDVKNGTGNETKPSRLTYFKKDKQLWCDFIPRFVGLVTEGQSFWAISTSDGQVLTYSHNSGRRVLPPLILGSPLSFLESHGDFLLAVTSIGELFVWNMAQRKICLNSTLSLASLLEPSGKFKDDGLSKSENITMCSVTSKGIPLVTLSNGSGYLYNDNLGVWQTISESWWAFGSHYWNSIGSDDNQHFQSYNLFGDTKESSIVEVLEQRTNELILRKNRTNRGKYFNKISKNMLMKEGFENLENTISLSHLENRILCCEVLGESKDFKGFLITYAKRICELGLRAKLFEICNELLGSGLSGLESNGNSSSNISVDGWIPEICGNNKRELLKEIILACAKNRDCQRILIHFGEKIGIVDELES